MNGHRRDSHPGRDREPTGAAASKRFGRYKGEAEKALRKAGIEESEGLRRIMDAWSSSLRGITLPLVEFHLLHGIGKSRMHAIDKNHEIVDYGDMHQAVDGLAYTARDVEAFSLMLEGFQDLAQFGLKAGFFLSALMNNGKDSGYSIHTGNLRILPAELGYKNKKRITVHGDVGESLGGLMGGGEIAVQGDALDSVGWEMADGSIIVEGSAGDYIGFQMKGGCVTIKGDAGANVGYGMSGGQIRLEGGFKGLSDDIDGGRIYHRGKLIFEG